MKLTQGQKQVNPQDLLSNLKVGIFRVMPGQRGKFLFVNPGLADFLGYTVKELLSSPTEIFFADAKGFHTLLEKIKRVRSIRDEEVLLKRKDGHFMWCSVTATGVKDNKGRIRYIDGVIEDISFRKRVEKELMESKELFRVVFDNSPVAITVTNKEEEIIAWNPFAEQLLGLTKEELFNKPVRELYPPAEWKRLRAKRVRQKGLLSNIETKIIKKNGEMRDVSVSIAVLKDAEGRISGAIGIMRDITEQKKAERELKQSEMKLRIILDHSSAGIIYMDKDDRIVSWNKFTEQLLRMEKKDLYGQHISTLYPPEEWRKIEEDYKEKSKRHYQVETKVLRKNGQPLDVDFSVNFLKDSSGKISGAVGMIQDITEKKKATQMLLDAKLAAEEASTAKSMFLANMSHEVRTPMNAIIGMIDMTLDTNLDEEQRDNLNTAKDAADNLLSLLNDILDLSRVESGKINLENIDFSLANVIRSVHKGLLVLARKKNLDLLIDIGEGVPEMIQGDPVRLRQIIINLVNNAIKFTSKGHVKISVHKLADMGEECQLQFAVEDTGIGIPQDKLAAIFDPFTQADDSTTRRFGGTGLGLAISKRLVEMMGGRIWVESEEGKGSTFYFTGVFTIRKKKGLKPIRVGSPSQKEEGKEKPLRPRPVLKPISIPKTTKIRILLAEDNLVNQKIAVKMLEKQGYVVTAVNNGEEALKALEEKEYDVVLMDVQMPIMDGLEATRRIREQETETGTHIPIVAMTAHAMEGDDQKCLAVGMDDYVSKPIDRTKLFSIIEEITKKK